MTTPVFGNCGNCAAWLDVAAQDVLGVMRRPCVRHAPEAGYQACGKWPWTGSDEGCFDWLPKPLAMEKNDG